MENFLNGYFYVILVPFVGGILPSSLVYVIYLVHKAKYSKERILQMISEALTVWIATLLFSKLYFETKPLLSIFSTNSPPYTVFAIAQVLVFLLFPVIPLLMHYSLYKNRIQNLRERLALSYCLFGIIAIIQLISLINSTPQLLPTIAKAPLVVIKLVDIVGLYDVLN